MQFFLYSLSSFTRANALEQQNSLYPNTQSPESSLAEEFRAVSE
jgi:hypothetical protein